MLQWERAFQVLFEGVQGCTWNQPRETIEGIPPESPPPTRLASLERLRPDPDGEPGMSSAELRRFHSGTSSPHDDVVGTYEVSSGYQVMSPAYVSSATLERDGQPNVVEEMMLRGPGSLQPKVESRNRVPKSKKIASQHDGDLSNMGPITSLMIRHIPCSVTQEELAKAVDDEGFAGKYDFLHLPLRGPARNRSNCGYGFINFPSEEDAQTFLRYFQGYHFANKRSPKNVEVRFAHRQRKGNANSDSVPGVETVFTDGKSGVDGDADTAIVLSL